MSRDITLHKTSIIGRRDSNEDAEGYVLNLSSEGKSIDIAFAPIDFFIICDGHGGEKVAKYVAPRLTEIFTSKNLTYPLSQIYINKIFTSVQTELIEHPKKIAKNCGCTVLIMVRYICKKEPFKKHIQIINCGDCRAILCRNGFAIPLSKDHKPSWPDEKNRINQVNKKYGTNKPIHFDGDWRIGDLSVSRSVGDLDNTPHVTHLPESFIYELGSDDEFVIIACDGLYDVVENHTAVNFVRDHLTNNLIQTYNIDGEYGIYPNRAIAKQINIARKLAEYAVASSSGDNISVMIVFFDRR